MSTIPTPAPCFPESCETYSQEKKTARPASLLEAITHPFQVSEMTAAQMAEMAQEIRERIIDTTAVNGGHLASSLGVVELTLALLSLFNPAHDKILWDVGHQAYAYKMLTGRAKRFHTLRQFKGISGFPHREESPYDHFGVGHSSTSLSAALGMATARDLAKQTHHVVSVIGDGALTAGMVFEAMNQAGGIKKPFIVILNDNDMSISKNVGALSFFMSRNLSARWVRRMKKEIEELLKNVPGIGDSLYEIARRSKHSFKNFFTPGILFEALNFNYIGPVNGHNIAELQQVLQLAKTLEKPVLVHVLTKKGKGYAPAETNPTLFHGIGSFDTKTGIPTAAASACVQPTFTNVFGETLLKLGKQDQRIFAITAAMPQGTGLIPFSETFPERFTDVGICEQHAVTYAAGLATQGYKPFVAIYSTFLQRAYDQIMHDVCLQKLPVTFCIDRAGLVGKDGATHQGAFDIAYLRHLPNITIFAPKDAHELRCGLYTALQHDGPFALRYPRGNVPAQNGSFAEQLTTLPIGQGEWLCKENTGTVIIALGHTVGNALEAAALLRKQGILCDVFNARWVKPLPKEDLKNISKQYDKLVIIEEHSLAGGFSSAVLEFFADAHLLGKNKILRLGLPDTFIEHGATESLRNLVGLDAQGIARSIQEFV